MRNGRLIAFQPLTIKTTMSVGCLLCPDDYAHQSNDRLQSTMFKESSLFKARVVQYISKLPYDAILKSRVGGNLHGSVRQIK